MKARMKPTSTAFHGLAALAVAIAFLQFWHPAGLAAASEQDGAAKAILEATGVRGGLVVHLGCGDGKLTAALRAGDAYLVHGLDADAKNIEAARKNVQSLGLNGKVSVEQWTGKSLPYVDNLVNLVVSEDAGAVPIAEVTRVLAPLGVAYVKANGQWTKTVKPWPQEIDEWTHYLHGPDNNAVAKDTRVGPPAGVQWVEGPFWQRSHEMIANPNAMVSAKGRLFYINDEAPATVSGLPDQWVLVARDAFNGTLLWKRPVPDWGWKAWSAVETGGRFNLPLHIPRRLVAAGDRVYVTLGFNAPLTALDAATGKSVKTYDGTQLTDEILFCDGLLILSASQSPHKPDTSDQRRQRRKPAEGVPAPSKPVQIDDNPSAKKRIVVLNAESGKILWTKDSFTGVPSSPIAGNQERIMRLLMAVDGGKVVCAEKDDLVGLDLKTGREIWRTPRPAPPAKQDSLRENVINFSTLVLHQDVALFLQSEESYAAPATTGDRGLHCKLSGFSADTGKTLWTLPCSKWGPGSEGDLFVVDGLAWTYDPSGYTVIGIEPHSGEIKRKIQAQSVFDEVHHHRCVRNKATERFILTERRGIETIDLRQGQTTKNEWVRGACRYGIMPCNGLIYVPPHPCQCHIDVKIDGFYALSSASSAPAPASPAESRLEKGPAYSDSGAARIPNPKTPFANASENESPIRNPQSAILNQDDWPTYRHDIRRGGSTGASAPAELKPLWETRVGPRLSACVIGGGRVFAASVDEHRVVALDAKDGRVLWNYTAAGRVDTPPTIYGERVLFGSADGWVYCLRAEDGAVAWRFRAAPGERRTVALGQLESLWPVHGTVLVSNGVAYVAAGRSTHLDGGIRVYALKPETGELIRELRPLNENPQGLEDVLVSDGERVYMRHLEFGLNEDRAGASKGGEKKAVASRLRAFSTAGLLDDSCFNRVGWSTGGKVAKTGSNKAAKTGASAVTGTLKTADLLVFDGKSTFAFGSLRQGGFGGSFQPASGAYRVTATDSQSGKPLWSVKIPVRVRALAAAGQVVFAAGSRDIVDPKDPWAAIEGRAGGVLWALAAGDGKKLAEVALDAAPIWDGLAVANQSVYLSTLDGKVIRMGQKQ